MPRVGLVEPRSRQAETLFRMPALPPSHLTHSLSQTFRYGPRRRHYLRVGSVRIPEHYIAGLRSVCGFRFRPFTSFIEFTQR